METQETSPEIDTNKDDQEPPTTPEPKYMIVRETPISKHSREPTLVPGEFLLGIPVPLGLFTPNGWDMHYLGDARRLDLNSSPAVMGLPTTRQGFFNIVDGTLLLAQLPC